LRLPRLVAAGAGADLRAADADVFRLTGRGGALWPPAGAETPPPASENRLAAAAGNAADPACIQWAPYRRCPHDSPVEIAGCARRRRPRRARPARECERVRGADAPLQP